MPYNFENQHIRLPREADRRVKLTEEQRKAIRDSSRPIRRLAIEYGVNRRAIDFIKHPEKLAENKKRRQERGGWRQYYNREQNSIAIKRHQRYKQWVLTERRGGIPAFAIAKMFVKCLGKEPFRRVTLDVWAEYNVPWATEKMLDSVWELVVKAQESVVIHGLEV